MNKTLVITGYDGEDYKGIFDLTLPSKVSYAAHHGYDLLVVRSFKPRYGVTNIGMLRLLASLDRLAEYDVVMWVDADAIITNKTMSLEEIGLDDSCCFYASYDYGAWALSGYMNTGNFVVKKTLQLPLLIATVYSMMRSASEEQTMMNQISRSTEVSRCVKILDNRYLGSMPMVVSERRRDIYGVGIDNPREWKSDHLIAHLAGLPNKDRIDITKKYFS